MEGRPTTPVGRWAGTLARWSNSATARIALTLVVLPAMAALSIFLRRRPVVLTRDPLEPWRAGNRVPPAGAAAGLAPLREAVLVDRVGGRVGVRSGFWGADAVVCHGPGPGISHAERGTLDAVQVWGADLTPFVIELNGLNRAQVSLLTGFMPRDAWVRGGRIVGPTGPDAAWDAGRFG